MSKVALSGNISGTGTFTIASPNSNTDRTLTLPDATGTVQVSGNPISGTTGTFSGAVSGTTGTFTGAVSGTTGSFPSGVSVGPSVTFGDATVQTTAAVAASTAYGGVGSYVVAYYGAASTAGATTQRISFLQNGVTVAGSSLRVSSRTTVDATTQVNGSPFFTLSPAFVSVADSATTTFPTANTTTGSGTGRLMVGGVWTYNFQNGCTGQTNYSWVPLMWVRIS